MSLPFYYFDSTNYKVCHCLFCRLVLPSLHLRAEIHSSLPCPPPLGDNYWGISSYFSNTASLLLFSFLLLCAVLLVRERDNPFFCCCLRCFWEIALHPWGPFLSVFYLGVRYHFFSTITADQLSRYIYAAWFFLLAELADEDWKLM